MPEIKIKVRDKCAEGKGVVICNNSDYTVVWDLDGEWTPYGTKTMRVNLADGTYQDVVFTGDNAPLPVLTASGWVSVGLYAGDLHTSRAARLLALSSVLTPVGSPAAPAEDVYAQIMAKLNELSTVSPEDIAKAVEDYLAEHPIEETDPTVPEWAKADITGAAVGQIAKIAAVDASGVPTAWSPVDMPSGGGDDSGAKEFRFIQSIVLDEQSDRVDVSVDGSGNAFALHEVYVMLAAQSYEDAAEYVYFLPNGRWRAGDPYITRANKSSKSSETWKNDMAFHSIYADGIICSNQLPAKGQNSNLTASFAAGQSIITKISIVSKFAAGCTFFVIGR